MVTQCTVCRTWFRISRDQLHVAHGLVRCSNCGTVFNALASLRDHIPESEAHGQASAPDAPVPEDDADEEPSASEPHAEPDSGPELAVLPVLGDPEGVHRVRRWPWAIAVTVAAVALVAQFVNAERRNLAAAPIVGPAVVAGYRMLGLRLSHAVSLSRYRIADASLNTVSGATGALRLSGTLRNRAPYSQPLPLIAVTLTDRYGATVASRLLSPQQYGAGSISAMGPHVDFGFKVKVADPGPRAVGFTLTLCKRRAGKVLCQAS